MVALGGLLQLWREGEKSLFADEGGEDSMHRRLRGFKAPRRPLKSERKGPYAPSGDVQQRKTKSRSLP